MGMIKTDREYEQTCRHVTGMRGAVDRQRATLTAAGLSPDLVELGIQPLLVMLDQMKGEVTWYENARAGKIRPLPDLTSIGLSLIALRLARGLTQRQLAERLGVNESQVSKDENNDYHGISVERAQRIIDALEGSVTLAVSAERPTEKAPELLPAR